jgi:chromosome segregation ATPase
MPMREIEVAPPAPRDADTDLVPRQRYEDAVEEVHHLRRELKEAETARRKAEVTLQEAGDEGERYRGKADRASRRIEDLLESLS